MEKDKQCKAPYKYHVYYLDTDVDGCSKYPTKCHEKQNKINCQIQKYTPNVCSKCASTFIPSQRPNPYQCHALCNKKVDYPIYVNGCFAEKLQTRNSCPVKDENYDLYKKIINNNGYIIQRQVADYTNIPLSEINKRHQSMLTYKYRNPPNPIQVWQKDSDYYDPILDTYGRPYTY